MTAIPCSPGCPCPRAAEKPATAGALAADDEELFLNEIVEAVYVWEMRLKELDNCPRSERDWRVEKAHEARMWIVDRFYFAGWVK